MQTKKINLRKKGTIIGNHVKDQHGKKPQGIAENFKILRKCQNKFDCLIFEMFCICDLEPKLNKVTPFVQSCLFSCFEYPLLSLVRFYFILTTSLCLYFAYLFSLFACKYLSTYLLISLLFHNCIHNAKFFILNLNLKMTVERSKCPSCLSLIFITKCFSKNLLIQIW